jgi:hypothetical protein
MFMPVREFVKEGVEKFTTKNIDCSAFTGDHWTFIHIPKTAGSSFREDIADVKQPEFNIVVDYSALDPQKLPDQYINMIRAELSKYCTINFDKTRFLSGHFTYRDIADLEKFKASKLVSMLRDPFSRLKSDYLYQVSADHPLWQSARRRYPTFRHFVENPDNHNVMFNYLCRSEADSIDDTIEFILDRFTWIGIQEDFRFSIKMLFMLFGMRIEPRRTIRKSAVDAENQILVSREDIRAVEINNEKDYRLYSFFLSQCQKRLAEFYDHSNSDQFFRKYNALTHQAP